MLKMSNSRRIFRKTQLILQTTANLFESGENVFFHQNNDFELIKTCDTDFQMARVDHHSQLIIQIMKNLSKSAQSVFEVIATLPGLPTLAWTV